jgi:hypothetical protein
VSESESESELEKGGEEERQARGEAGRDMHLDRKGEKERSSERENRKPQTHRHMKQYIDL